MPAQLLSVVCADYQAKLATKFRHARAVTDAARRYQRGDATQIDVILFHLRALRELHDASAELLFAADTAVTVLMEFGERKAIES